MQLCDSGTNASVILRFRTLQVMSKFQEERHIVCAFFVLDGHQIVINVVRFVVDCGAFVAVTEQLVDGVRRRNSKIPR